MNPLILTKISKFVSIAGLSAFVGFISKFQPQVRTFFIYLYCGVLIVLILAAIWEGREQFTDETPEQSLTRLMPSMSPAKEKRLYLLSPTTRLEIVIGIVVLTIGALVGMI